ncbi:outer membrane protein assembly factor BamD [Arcobacter sp. CECT 8986]|uniref:outer membrane protein assembly factor BamD n=1 Tax=Arcobacter sp. CECT 8986 TaxID=2044507 RepID=UPI001009A8C8|nr:outer membrane protein assembly factor BamD [Arcobacter sp. CECT 8986]RXJ98786.1 outer membrane protein assembly factor BamD [Arcobacter sp. CECT 8986]
MIRNLNFKNLLMVCSAGLILASCSSKSNQIEEYDRPALYWYNKMTKQIADFDLEAADDTFTSLESEHRNSPLLPTSLIILANAHMDEEEYALANFYLDEYIKKYTLSKEIDYVRYLKIKANFKGFSYQLRDQQLIDDTIKEIQVFKQSYPSSKYMPLVDTMDSRLHMAKANLNLNIADLYKRIDKPKAAKIYSQKADDAWSNTDDIAEVEVPFYRSVFE